MLNPKQRAAVTFGDGAALILAGPGAGKTHVLTHRVHHLITGYHIPSEQILVITFTKAAAEEMKQRHLALCGGGSRAVFGTFHSFFLSLLKEELHLTNDDILDAKTRIFLLQKTAEELKIATDRLPDFFGNIEKEISYVKNADICPQGGGTVGNEFSEAAGNEAPASAAWGESPYMAAEDVPRDCFSEKYVPRDLSSEQFAAFLVRYEKAKDIYGKIDFDDMLNKARELLLSRKDILEKWRRRYRYFLVDECQDMNGVQLSLVRLLAAPANNVFFVGDDDQSIYGFRAADPGWMRTFDAIFPGSVQIILDTNYRSAPAVVAASKRLIRHNQLRIDKDYAAAQVSVGRITCQSLATSEEEAAYLADALYAEQRKQPQKTIAVLFRNHAQSERVIAALKRKALAFRYYRKEENPYDFFVYRDVCAYFALAAGSRRRADMLRVMNRPNRFLSRAGLEEETVSFDEWAAYHTDAPAVVRAIRTFEKQIAMLERMSSFAAWNYLLRGMGYGAFVDEQAQKEGNQAAVQGEAQRAGYGAVRGVPGQKRPGSGSAECEQAFATIERLARQYPDKKTFLDALRVLRSKGNGNASSGNGSMGAQSTSLEDGRTGTNALSEHRKARQASPAPIRLLSFHGAKGLEFDHVYIIDACEGITPSKKAKSEKELEEERRMFYVAATRAKEELTLLTIARRGNETLYPSRFIKEMAGEGDADLRYCPGQRV